MRIKQRFNMCNDCLFFFFFFYNKNHYKDPTRRNDSFVNRASCSWSLQNQGNLCLTRDCHVIKAALVQHCFCSYKVMLTLNRKYTVFIEIASLLIHTVLWRVDFFCSFLHLQTLVYFTAMALPWHHYSSKCSTFHPRLQPLCNEALSRCYQHPSDYGRKPAI